MKKRIHAACLPVLLVLLCHGSAAAQQARVNLDYLFVGLGTHENQPTNRTVVFHAVLEKHAVKHDYYIGGNGGHDWATWRDHLHARLLPNLFRTK
jgi:enterochelin esterase family protein